MEPNKVKVEVKEEVLDLGEDVIVLSDEDENDLLLCDQCGFQAFSDQKFSRHFAHHIPPQPKLFKCGQCQFQATYKGDLNTHHSKEHAVTIKQEIKREYDSFSHDIKPSLSALEPKLMKCHQCPFVTSTNHSLVRHYKDQHSGKVYYCGGKCYFKTTSEFSLLRHMRAHDHKVLPEKPCICCPASKTVYKCSKCDYKNFCKTMVKNHLKRMHSLQGKTVTILNVRWFKCGICPFKAQTENEVSLHIHNFHFARTVK